MKRYVDWCSTDLFMSIHGPSFIITTWHFTPVAELVNNGCKFFLVLFIKYLP
jgi:hypothetical protein